jgi:LAO/AO transport system kinase
MRELVEPLRAGNRRALARLLTAIENGRDGVEDALAALFPHTGRAWVVGITGAPGTGKSTLVNALAKAYRAQGKTVAVLAVDPTSPFSGGAILGDRIRMRDLSGDPGVFIRSMATRGNLGGLARTTLDAIRAFDAAGFDVVLVETVGAGQSEVDIVQAANTTLVIEAPGMGDDVQAIKAGILEIADILVVNKADRPGADATVRSLRAMLDLGHPPDRSQMLRHHGQLLEAEPAPATPDDAPLWIPPIVQTVASKDEGIDALLAEVERHLQHLTNAGSLEALERQRLEVELHHRLREALLAQLLNAVPPEALSAMIEAVQVREMTPQSAVQRLLREASSHRTGAVEADERLRS